MIKIENLSKTYEDGTKALHNINLTVPDGQFLVIIGLSGSGKSTLLRCINGLIKPTSGQVFVDGENITTASTAQLRKIRLKIGMIFQQFNLVRRSSVMTNVLTGRLGYKSSDVLFVPPLQPRKTIRSPCATSSGWASSRKRLREPTNYREGNSSA